MTQANDTPLQLVVGLGNPGAEHVLTRHNAGFWFVDALAEREGGRFTPERKYHGDLCRVNVAGNDLRLLKPATFMNRSGQAVQALASYLKLPPEAILVVHDDLDLPAGTLRLKWSGGHGGHNGLRDITSHLGPNFRRLRIGIGHPGNSREVIDYVLQRARPDEEQQIIEAVGRGLDLLPELLDRGFEYAMHKLHTGTGDN
ncbi:MAG TPA: aminoacyl-tRNA hydrolase [Gammaproteobacteria bacterium]|nr:aminoacyl-tRNA hydrolase [Gammaproteobacteria bacterium]